MNGTNVTGSGCEDEEWAALIRQFSASHPVESWKEHGFFDEAYLGLINRHWLAYEPASALTHHLFAGLYVFIMVSGWCGNFLVIFMFIRCRSLRTPANYLILNLALSDLLMLTKMPIFIYNSYYEGPALGSIGCKIYGFVGGLSGTASIMTLTWIALDRYAVILNPLNPMKKTTHCKALGMILSVWIYSAFFASFPLFGLNNYVAEGYLTSCSFDYLSTELSSRLFIFIYFVAAWVVPVILIIFSYASIFRVVFMAERLDLFTGARTMAKESFKTRKRQDKLRREVKIAMITSMIIVVWMLAWTPYAVVALLGIFGQAHLITPLVSAIPALFCKTASCIDPFMYAINHPRFQRELRERCKNGFPNVRRRRRASRTFSQRKNRSLETVSNFNSNDSPSRGGTCHSFSCSQRSDFGSPRTLSARNTPPSQRLSPLIVVRKPMESTSVTEASTTILLRHLNEHRQLKCGILVSSETIV